MFLNSSRARVVIHVLAHVLLHVLAPFSTILARVVIHVLARVFLHVLARHHAHVFFENVLS